MDGLYFSCLSLSFSVFLTVDFSHEMDDVDQNDTEGEAASESEGILSFITHFMTCTGSLC